jgi:hypothetical protein
MTSGKCLVAVPMYPVSGKPRASDVTRWEPYLPQTKEIDRLLPGPASSLESSLMQAYGWREKATATLLVDPIVLI